MTGARATGMVAVTLLLVVWSVALLWVFVDPAEAGEPTWIDPADTVCVEDGQPGMIVVDGSCLTAAEYDVIFSYEALDLIPSGVIDGVSVADIYGLDPNGPRASERPRSFMGEQLPTFTEVLWLVRTGCPC